MSNLEPRIEAVRKAYDLLGVSSDERCEYRVVFWFDN
jgi:hypothetical protein